jgi:uncharacterized membrane protein YccF (DUF307 family)
MVFTKMDRQQAIGMLKARGTADPDVLYGSMAELVASFRTLKNLLLFPLILGMVITVFMAITIIGIPLAVFFGIPLTVVSFWLRGNAKKNIATVEAAYAELTGGAVPGSQDVLPGPAASN